ncbi:MAG TPA: hypothetical protein VLS27_17770 [Gammaproteobacteria bacterium]|nr:hypothetical protein [Gammaproteobacteria bacterium]
MLGFYISLANRLHRARAIVWFLAAISAGGFVTTLFLSQGKADEAYMLAFIALLLWSLCLLVLIYTFIHPLPVIEREDGFFSRAKKKLALGMRWVMAWTMTLLCVAVVYVSFRAGSIAVQSLGA